MPKSTLAWARRAALATLALLLAACSSALIPAGPGPPMIPLKQARGLGAAPIQGAKVKFALTTVTGMPGRLQIAFDESIKKFAASRNLTLVAYGDNTATYRVQGYVSAVGDVNRVLVVYVWDIYDASGNRIHRLSGQEPTGGGGADPWTAVNVQVIDDAARQTIDALADWARA
jgi:hypothetical protein